VREPAINYHQPYRYKLFLMNSFFRSFLLRGSAVILAAFAGLSAQAQVNGEFRSAASGAWSAAATWETYNSTSSTWATATAAPSGNTAIVSVRNGHTVQLTSNVSFKKVTIDAGGSIVSDASERRMDFVADTSYLINNGNLGGAAASNSEKIGLTPTPTCSLATISGTGTTSVARIRFNTSSTSVTLNATLLIDHNMNITSSGITAYYNNASNTNAENATVIIAAGRTVTAGGGLHSNATTSTNAGGSYTYIINGTLDMSGTTATTYFYPLANAASTITLNVSGLLKLRNLNTAYTGTNAGSVVMNILNGGVVDVSNATTFNLGSKYFFVSGNGKLRRAVPTTATSGVLFPIGTSATSYNPVTLMPGSADDTFAVGVSNSLSYPIGDPSKIVNKQWELVPSAGGAGVTPTFGWVTADQAGGFVTSNLRIFRYSAGPPAGWAAVSLATPVSGAGTVASPYTTSTATTPASVNGLYVVGDSTAAVVVTPTVSISAAPGSTVCAGVPVTFTATTTNISNPVYQWLVNNTPAGTNSATFTTSTLTNGAVVKCEIRYAANGPVAATSNEITVTVNPQPVAGTLSGPGTVCSGTSGQFTSTAAGGTWSSSNNTVATVSASGVVTGVSVGNITLTYSVTNGCGTATTTAQVAVTLGADAGVLSGAATVCPAATTTLSSTVPGGVWTTSNASIATVSTNGVVTGVGAGNAAIVYTITNGCGTDTAQRSITVNPAPDAGSISGPTVACVGSTITLASNVAGGTWTSSSAAATVNSSGVVSGVSTGNTVITYSVTNSCGTDTAQRTLAVSTTPTVQAITGPSTVCPNATITLADSTQGGIWSSNNGNVSVSSAGIVTGISSGTSVIMYTVSNACGAASATRTITIGALPTAAIVNGPDTVCLSGNITLFANNPNGLWSTTQGKAIVATDGLVTGLSQGLDTVVYSVTNACGTARTNYPIYVRNCAATGVRGVAGLTVSAAVYPNPNAGTFSLLVSSPTADEFRYVVTNAVGAIVLSGTARANTPVLLAMDVPAGMYLLHAAGDTGRASIKITIAR